MYEYILKNKRATYAFDPINGTESFENTKNINEIIIVTNNLEHMNMLYDKYDEQYEEELNEFKHEYKKIVLSIILYSVIGLLISIPYYGLMIGMLIPFSKTLNLNIKETKLRKRYIKKLNIIRESIEKEKKYLDFLKKTDEKVEIKENQEKIELEPSEEVSFLISQIHLIDFVKQNYKKLKEIYKANLLDETLEKDLSQKEIDYIKFLLNRKKEKKKVKQLKK